MYILLLEDKATDADLTRRNLEQSINDCKVEVFPTVKQAKEALKKECLFDIALLDMQLPDGTGLDLLMEIRISELYLPVIMITGSGNEEVATAVLKAGADDYVIKEHGYIENLPDIIDYAIKSFHKKSQEFKEIIDVLYIEHHTSDIDLTLRHMSQFAPYIRIDFVATAEAALEKLVMYKAGTYKCQVILLDYRLPGINALEFIKIIRQERKLSVPIILVTGQGNEDVAIQALKLGANDYMVKRENYLFRLSLAILNVYQHTELIKKQAIIAESESKYRLLADNSGDVIFVLDTNLNYTYVSPSVKELRGFDCEEAIKQQLNEVLTPDSFQKVTTMVSEFLIAIRDNYEETSMHKTVQLEMLKKDKTSVWTEVKASLLLDETKTPIGILGVTRDISLRKTAIDKLRKLSQAVEQSLVSVIITDLKGDIEYVNPKFTKISGYTFEEVKGNNPRILKSSNKSSEEYKHLWNTITNGGEWNGDLLNMKKDGSTFWESAYISPIRNEEGEITHFLAVKEDITEKKIKHEELVIAKEHAEESDRLKSAFLANMSHEIRTPMNGILGFAELLKMPELTGNEQREYISIIEKSGARMLNIINDIVDISKIESNQMKVMISETNVNEQMEYIDNFFKAEVDKKGLQLTLIKTLTTSQAIQKTDREKLYSILTNLIKNAIKFTDEGSIEFGCYLNEKLNAVPFLEFFVKDTGIGIPKNRIEAIFERFIQADITNKMARQGAGLGLAISKAYVEMLDGRIWVESEEGKGSVFYFTIPCTNLSETKTIVTNSLPNVIEELSIKPLKIIIADDDDASSLFLSLSVRKFGQEVIVARNGIEAVEACRNNPDFDLILMDIQMPEMNGFEATRQIRKFNQDVVIIAQTAFSLAGDKEKALEAGCNDYLSKPIKKEILNKIIQKYFSIK